MTDNNATKNLSAMPVIYVHAKGRQQISNDQLETLLELGLPLCSRLELKGVTQTKFGFDQASLIIAEISDLFPGSPIIFLRAGLQPTKYLLEQLTALLDQSDQPIAMSLLSNADNSVNPFSGLQASGNPAVIDPNALVCLLAPGEIHTLLNWTDHFAILSAKLISQLLTATHDGSLMDQVNAVGGKLLVPVYFPAALSFFYALVYNLLNTCSSN